MVRFIYLSIYLVPKVDLIPTDNWKGSSIVSVAQFSRSHLDAVFKVGYFIK